MAFSCLVGSEIQVSNLERVIEAETCLFSILHNQDGQHWFRSICGHRILWVLFVDCPGTPPHFLEQYVKLTEDS